MTSSTGTGDRPVMAGRATAAMVLQSNDEQLDVFGQKEPGDLGGVAGYGLGRLDAVGNAGGIAKGRRWVRPEADP